MKKRLFCSAIALLACFGAMAQENSLSEPASIAFPFSQIVRNTSALSMGAVGSAYEAARLFNDYTVDANAGYTIWAPSLGTSSNNIVVDAAGKFADKIGAILSVAYDNGKPYTMTDANGKSLGTFSPADISFKLGGSYIIADFLAAGANVKYYSSKLTPSDNLSAIGADVYVAGYFHGLSTSIGVSSIGGAVDGFSLPASAYLTAGFDSKIAEKASLKALLQTDYFFGGAVSVGTGVELGIASVAFLRAGYHFASDTAVIPSFASVGLGFNVKGIKLDAAYLVGSESLGNTMQFSLGYKF